MTDLVVAPLLVALVAAILTLALRVAPRAQRAVAVLGTLGYAAAVALLVRRVLAAGPQVYQLSGWEAPYGITLVADGLSAFMLGMTAIVVVAAGVFATSSLDRFAQRIAYHPLAFFMIAGATGAFLTGDVFNLFVWFEVMLLPSYVLVVFYGEERHTLAALHYTALNLVGSGVMLLAIGGLYATTGTLNMADMGRRLAAAGEPGAAIADPVPVLGLAALLFTVFALKAGLVPFQFWVPEAYGAAPAPATALLAGVTKKVGVYAIVRLTFTVFAGTQLPGELALPGFSGDTVLAFFGPVMFAIATATILLGGIAATSRADLEAVFAYSSIGQIGFVLLPIAVAATAPSEAIRRLGILAGLVYALNHSLAKSLLFLLSGAIQESIGSTRLSELGGLAGTQPGLTGAYFVGALALIGVPPLTGFFGKLLVFDVAGRASAGGAPFAPLALAVALAGAVLTIAYLTRVWNLAFWGDASPLVSNARVGRVPLAVLLALATILIALGVGFDPIFGAAEAGADAALDRTGYATAVLGGEGA